jgi:hypothetical protein
MRSTTFITTEGGEDDADDRPPFKPADQRAHRDCLNPFPPHVPDPYPDRSLQIRLAREARLAGLADAEQRGGAENLDADGKAKGWNPSEPAKA